MIDGHCDSGNFEQALRLLDVMEAKGLRLDEVSYGALLSGLYKLAKFDIARSLLERMRMSGMVVGYRAYTAMIDVMV